MKRMVTENEVAEIASAVAIDEIEDATIESSQLSSGEATEGQVLTADGEGGVSWEDASGGVTLYRHRLHFPLETGASVQYGNVCLILVTSSSEAFTAATLKTYLKEKGINGQDSNNIYAPIDPYLRDGVVYSLAQLAVNQFDSWACYARGFKIDNGALATSYQSSLSPSTSSAYFKDYVDAI